MVSRFVAHSIPASQAVLTQGNTTLATEPTVILGGGIIGLSTAYYLALAEVDARPNSIFVVDPSSTICAGASSQNEGALGRFGFKEEVWPLTKLSYKLHHQLTSKYDGRTKFGYSEFKIHILFSKGYDPKNPRLPYPVTKQETLSVLPSWATVPKTWQAGLISNGSDSAKVDPVQFCTFLHEECQRLGVQFLFQSSATRVQAADGKGLSSFDIESASTKESVRLPCRNLLISAGSWTQKFFASLFPRANCKVPMTDKQPAQTWLRFTATDGKAEANDTSEQIWFNPAIQEDLHISSFLDGELYVAGAMEDVELVALPEKFHPDSRDVTGLTNLAKHYLRNENGENWELTNSGRAYMPRTSNDLPVITRVEWDRVFLEKSPIERNYGEIYVNVGQYLVGFTLGPASGKVMSELIRGEKPSIDLTGFGLSESSEL